MNRRGTVPNLYSLNVISVDSQSDSELQRRNSLNNLNIILNNNLKKSFLEQNRFSNCPLSVSRKDEECWERPILRCTWLLSFSLSPGNLLYHLSGIGRSQDFGDGKSVTIGRRRRRTVDPSSFLVVRKGSSFVVTNDRRSSKYHGPSRRVDLAP